MALYRVAALDEIPVGEGRCVEVEGRAIAVFNLQGDYRAIDNTCPHRGGPLADGSVQGTTVSCPWHGWQFDCLTGRSFVNPAVGVATFKTKVDNGAVFVEV